MKKTFLALSLMIATATVASGAAIKWSIGGAIDPPEGTTIGTDVGSFILAYIGTTAGVGIDADTFNAGVGTSYSIVDTGSWKDFENTRRNTYNNTKTKNVADVDKATYQVFYVKDGVYSLVNDPWVSTAAISIDETTQTASVTAYVDKNDGQGRIASGASLFAAGGSSSPITSVPEPSVALMGLLGLGMLLKRRKA